MNTDLILKYFPELTDTQISQFSEMAGLYQDWNQKINVVSRKDVDELYLRHILHSLGIAKVLSFLPGSKVLDVGTGGGFPGIPLAVLFPDTQFTLVDSIGKKIRVVKEVIDGLGLRNVEAIHARVEDLPGSFDFIVSRAVAAMPTFVRWVDGKVSQKSVHPLKNGILYLKGGDLREELQDFSKAHIYPLSEYFEEDFFATKVVVHLPLGPTAGS
ncbi:16S rRNA (guanine(527)-N(7))-methyltransferase RsmG [Muriicola marianensis]|uniref:Ribosomal RNA small subunit methyltransferase G n=1 Tax=Muriicola marianensis TaxID=1324801 RepID=A0ABQ1QV53_9FLAO|nr:16S rRNA (guanine(527)-N(7))-methyltransferase RsmG [Muriicola marianensis]GGD44902.1 ribosomal RNA small subunit methyltransferase G [Muriicola marianensis]